MVWQTAGFQGGNPSWDAFEKSARSSLFGAVAAKIEPLRKEFERLRDLGVTGGTSLYFKNPYKREGDPVEKNRTLERKSQDPASIPLREGTPWYQELAAAGVQGRTLADYYGLFLQKAIPWLKARGEKEFSIMHLPPSLAAELVRELRALQESGDTEATGLLAQIRFLAPEIQNDAKPTHGIEAIRARVSELYDEKVLKPTAAASNAYEARLKAALEAKASDPEFQAQMASLIWPSLKDSLLALHPTSPQSRDRQTPEWMSDTVALMLKGLPAIGNRDSIANRLANQIKEARLNEQVLNDLANLFNRNGIDVTQLETAEGKNLDLPNTSNRNAWKAAFHNYFLYQRIVAAIELVSLKNPKFRQEAYSIFSSFGDAVRLTREDLLSNAFYRDDLVRRIKSVPGFAERFATLVGMPVDQVRPDQVAIAPELLALKNALSISESGQNGTIGTANDLFLQHHFQEYFELLAEAMGPNFNLATELAALGTPATAEGRPRFLVVVDIENFGRLSDASQLPTQEILSAQGFKQVNVVTYALNLSDKDNLNNLMPEQLVEAGMFRGGRPAIVRNARALNDPGINQALEHNGNLGDPVLAGLGLLLESYGRNSGLSVNAFHSTATNWPTLGPDAVTPKPRVRSQGFQWLRRLLGRSE